MDIIGYLEFCPPGTPYFDVPTARGAAEADYPLSGAEPPDGWTRTIGPEWVVLAPPEPRLPAQGWKIHVSATPDNAEHVLDTVAKYCTTERVMFKFLRGPGVLKRRNGKYGDRGGSGKFVTIYPLNETHLARVLAELGDLLHGEPGPYILSDLRWRSGPLYVRYGGFVLRAKRTSSGESVYCIENPDGELVPDRRGPGFRPPEWVTLPDCLREAVADRNSGVLRDFPFRVTRALHFSNGGGVYRGVDTRDGRDVLIREARPYAGLDGDGQDAVTRLGREHRALERLRGAPCVPELIDHRKGHEHYYLIRAYAEGTPLSKEMTRRNPLVRGSRDHARFAEYAHWALRVLDQIEAGVAGMHERGVVFGDLHPGNVLVDKDGTVTFIDFETASDTDSQSAQHMGAVGFMAPVGYTGRAVDRYALGCLRLAVFAPLAGALTWSPHHKAAQLLDLLAAHYPLPDDFAAKVYADLGTALAPTVPTARQEPLWPAPRPDEWPALRGELRDGILDAATPERTDRLFPGDAQQFVDSLGGAAFAYGAAGVLWTLHHTGTRVPPEHLDWLTTTARSAEEPPPGFHRGLSGIAHTLADLGREEEAQELLGRITPADLDRADDSLHDGLAGIGLTHLDLALRTGEGDLLAVAHGLAARMLERPAADPAAYGLVRGPAGGALFLLRMYEHSGETDLLAAAERRVRADLAGLGWRKGTFAEDAAGRLPLFAGGSGGTGIVLHDLLARLDGTRPELLEAHDAILRATALSFTAQGGLFHGRAGVLMTLLRLSDGRPDQEAVRRHLDGLGLHAVRLKNRPAFLGTECLRVSTDLATGTAGILGVLDTALGDDSSGHPFL
ncbi:class III lanthionine synthetase LanKC [Streptomyces sp. NPDC029674]|uniref:class III lanthionine synthetase LanKC n=1 Tax=Streptomyces sp. NPDC029674 TaxID=3365297 RepID=UPI00384C3CA0